MHFDETFWTAVAFVIFVVAAAKPAWRAITSALDERAERIRSQLEEATRLREEAQAMLAGLKRKQRDALQEADAILDHAKSEAERHRTEAAAALEASIKRREEAALAKIAAAEQAALREVRDRAIEVAIAATGTLLADEMGRREVDPIVEGAIAELPSRLQ